MKKNNPIAHSISAQHIPKIKKGMYQVGTVSSFDMTKLINKQSSKWLNNPIFLNYGGKIYQIEGLIVKKVSK